MLHRCHPLAPGTGSIWGWGISTAFWGGVWQGAGSSWLCSSPAHHEAAKHCCVSCGGGEGTVSCRRQHLSSHLEVTTATAGWRRLCVSLATVPFLARRKCLGTVSPPECRGSRAVGCRTWLWPHCADSSCLSICLILRALLFLFCLQTNLQL